MQVTVLVVHVLTALGLIGLVLLQHGKGADMGAAFGSGSAGSLFGSSGSSNFLSRSTAVFALIFFFSSMERGHPWDRPADRDEPLLHPVRLAPEPPVWQRAGRRVDPAVGVVPDQRLLGTDGDRRVVRHLAGVALWLPPAQ